MLPNRVQKSCQPRRNAAILMQCTRCFRNSHTVTTCYAVTTLAGKPLYRNTKRVATRSQELQPKAAVYVLHLQHGKIYVGLSDNIPRRIHQHVEGNGSAWTTLYPPQSATPLPPLAVPTTHGPTDERNETLHRMRIHGIDNVRGYKWTTLILTQDQRKTIQEEMAENFNLCRACFAEGHFIKDCPNRILPGEFLS